MPRVVPDRLFAPPQSLRLSRGRTRPAEASATPVLSWREIVRVLALQDLILLGYLATVFVALLATSAGHELATELCLRRVALDAALLLVGAYVARGGTGVGDLGRRVIYRLCLVGVLVDTYLMLRDLLPLVRKGSVDAALHRIDVALFGVEPALWMERWNRPEIVEWFAFFYFSYFAIAALYMTGIVWLRRADRATTELAIGVLIVFCVGQLGYMLVPGFGPVKHLASSFHGPVDGGFFWSCVERTVAAGGANKDVFPSLHTAAPTFFAIFAWRRARTERLFRVVAPVTTFFAANIIVSTMLLRWHYAIDVVAGLALAAFAGFAAPRLAAAEERWRSARGLALPWSSDAVVPAPSPERPSLLSCGDVEPLSSRVAGERAVPSAVPPAGGL
jgi:membrane-associated phospholipid phosphatase